MSNEFVQASVNFLTESWYKENAGTPEYQEAKYLEQAFDDIVEFCLQNGLEIEESIEIASDIIEEDMVEEFYERFLNEQGMMDLNAVRRERQRAVDARNRGNTTRVTPGSRAGVRWTAEGPTGPNPKANPPGAPGTVNTPAMRARDAAERANRELRRQLAARDSASRTTPRPASIPARTAPTTASTPRLAARPTTAPTPKPAAAQGPLTVGGQGVATNTGSLPREPQAPFDKTRPIIRSIFRDKSNPLR
jgi:hypothetical protein